MKKYPVRQISLKIAKDNSKHLFVEYTDGILLSEDMDFETTHIAFGKLEYRLKQVLLEFGLELSLGEIEMNVMVK